MQHPFAGVAQSQPTTTPSRRNIVGGLLSVIAGALGWSATAKAGTTTLVVGEEGGLQGSGFPTSIFGEQGLAPTYGFGESGSTSLAFGEEGGVTGGFGESGFTGAYGEFGAQPPQPPSPPPPADLSPQQLQDAWKDLGSADAVIAQRAIRLLAAGKQSLPFLREHLKPAEAPPGAERLAQWIRDLDGNTFEVRQRASAALENVGPPAEAVLRKALENGPSLELRRRVEAVQARSAGLQRQYRQALHVLALAPPPEALALLVTLAQGHASAWQTTQALSALSRLRSAAWATWSPGAA